MEKGEEWKKRTADNIWEIWRLQAAPGSVWKANIHYVCFTGAGSRSSVGDRSQAAEKPTTLPQTWFTLQKDISPCVTWRQFIVVSPTFAKFMLLQLPKRKYYHCKMCEYWLLLSKPHPSAFAPSVLIVQPRYADRIKVWSLMKQDIKLSLR